MFDKLTKIASRVFVSFSCRKCIIEHGFDYDGADSGFVLFNYYRYPILWAYQKDGKVKIVNVRKAEDTYSDFIYARNTTVSGMGEIAKIIDKWMKEHPRGVTRRNFSVHLWVSIWKHGMSQLKDARFLIHSFKIMEIDEARSFFSKNYDVSIIDFNKAILGSPSSGNEKTFKWGKMDFIIDDSTLEKEFIESKMGEVKSKLPPFLAEKLLYGRVELKDKFASKNTLADYFSKDDIIRINAKGDIFVPNMLHELGHRWHFKFSNDLQQKKLSNLYKLCRNMDSDCIVDLKHDDEVELDNGKMFRIFSEDGLYYWFEEIDRWGEAIGDLAKLPKKFFRSKRVVRLNGEPLTHKYVLPSAYAGKNIKEFVAVCFECVYYGYNIGDTLAREFKEIVENGQD